jgi:predicted permease
MWMAKLLSMWRRLVRSSQADRELQDDVEAYANLLADDLEIKGLSSAEARRRARAALGGVEPVKEGVREVRVGARLELVWRDVRHAWRGLRRSPGFTAATVLTMGLGLGVTTTVFSVLDSAVLEPLPYERPEELMEIGHHMRVGTPMEVTAIGMSWAEAHEWAAAETLIQGVEAETRGVERRWLEGDKAIQVASVTAGVPDLLGISPSFGRMFTAMEVAEGAPVVVIAEAFWSSAFGRRRDVLGATMTIDGVSRTIVGVLPSSFRFGPGGGGRVMAWTGLDERAPEAARASHLFRLRSGLTLDEAHELAGVVAERLQQANPSNEPWIPELLPLDRSRREIGSRMQNPMLLLLATAGVVLLIACVNVANLLLTRGGARRPELAMRAALGASRGRLARLLLAEGITVAVLGGVAAVLLATWSSGALTQLMPDRLRSSLSVVSEPGVDWRVLTFAVVVTAVVALLSAGWPAISASRVELRSALEQGDRLAAGGRQRASRLLQAGQVALAFVLASTAGLLATSFAAMLTADLGFDARGLGVVSFTLPEGRYESRDAKTAAMDDVVTRVRATPGVKMAAIGGSPAATGSGNMLLPGGAETVASLAFRTVGLDYMQTAGIRLVAGRDFGPEDSPSSPLVALIDDVGARHVFGDELPIGKRFTYSPYVPEVTIVGVAERVAASDFASRPDRVGVFLAASQNNPPTSLLVRADRNLGEMLADVRRAIEAFDSGIVIRSTGEAVDYYETMETYATPRFYLVLISTFAVLALATTSIGLYGLLAHAVGRRRREIGVRIALGAAPGRIRRLVLAEALMPVVVGLALGGLAAWWTLGLADSLVYAIGPRDPRAFAIAATALGLTAVAAVVAPVRRAMGVDPIVALREQ